VNIQINGWVVLLILGLVLMGYAAGFITVKAMLPAAMAELTGHQELVKQVNTVLGQYQKDEEAWKAKVNATLEVLKVEKRK